VENYTLFAHALTTPTVDADIRKHQSKMCTNPFCAFWWSTHMLRCLGTYIELQQSWDARGDPSIVIVVTTMVDTEMKVCDSGCALV
jgi:hypothetical protein